MKKIISLFQRNYDTDGLVRDEIVPGAEWVTSGEGMPTRKWDGTCAMVRDGKLFKRYDAKRGKTPPPGWEPAQDADPVTGHHPGWIAVGDGPEDKWFRDAWEEYEDPPEDGTYELVGPKVQGNPEWFEEHVFIPHGQHQLIDVPVTFNELREYLSTRDIEGIVWHHPDGRMVKIKVKDFGLKRYHDPR